MCGVGGGGVGGEGRKGVEECRIVEYFQEVKLLHIETYIQYSRIFKCIHRWLLAEGFMGEVFVYWIPNKYTMNIKPTNIKAMNIKP